MDDNRTEQIAAVVKAVYPLAELRDRAVTVTREEMEQAAGEMVDRLNIRKEWKESIPDNVWAVYDRYGRVWQREGYLDPDTDKREPIDSFVPFPTPGAELIEQFGPVSNLPPVPSPFNMDPVGFALRQALKALEMVNNGKRNREYFLKAESALRKATQEYGAQRAGGAEDEG